VCVVLCTMFRLFVVLFCVMCFICVLCLIVVPLPPGENPFAVIIIQFNSIYLHANLTAKGQLQSEHVEKEIEMKHTEIKPKLYS
jgi:hypothetical protein